MVFSVPENVYRVSAGYRAKDLSSVWIRQKRSKSLPSESCCYLCIEGFVYAFVKQLIGS